MTWEGSIRAALQNQHVYPKTEGGRIRTWIGVGGSPESVVRAAQYGFPLVLAVIGGSPARFAPFIDLYHRALREFGQDPQPVAVHAPGFIAATDDEAIDVLWPHAQAQLTRIGRERGWPPITRERFESDVAAGRVARRLARDRGPQDREHGANAEPGPLRPEVLGRQPAARATDDRASSCTGRR